MATLAGASVHHLYESEAHARVLRMGSLPVDSHHPVSGGLVVKISARQQMGPDDEAQHEGECDS